MKIITRILKRNHQLYKENCLYKRINLCLIRDNDNAFQRNKKAVEYIDKAMKKSACSHLVELREILTTFKTDNVLNEVNK